MATTGKRRKHRVTKTLATKRRRPSSRRKTKKRALSAGGGSPRRTWMKTTTDTLGGATGGAIYTAPAFFIGLPWWGKLLWGIGGAVASNRMGFDHAGSGMAGAMVNDLARSQMGTMLKDGDLEDAEWVDADTLSDTGYLDEEGNEVFSDDDGIIYALNDDGDYEAIGDISDLPKTGMQGATGLPLTAGNPYDLQDVYSLSQGY